MIKLGKLVLLGALAFCEAACGGVPNEQGEADTDQVKSEPLTGDALAIRFYNSGLCLEYSGSALLLKDCRFANDPHSNSTQKWGFPNHSHRMAASEDFG